MDPTYLNPVYPHAAPDPFALKFCGEYWVYHTGIEPDGRVFGILHSPDLVHWHKIGSAMDALPGGHTCYWAPEVSYWNGVFYLYYSVGNEENMQLRVATAPHPAGPFVDSGRRLTSEPFAIDAHVFEDEDGSRYLFYATDFLDAERVGTATVMDRMLDPYTLAGSPRPVTLAKFDWQIYDPARKEKGGVRWHTVEGPFVLKHNGRYYQMFSGGNWKTDSYGVAYATTTDLDTPGEWEQRCDGEILLPPLRSNPAQGVIGPGHNSVVRGLDNQELFCVYHRWQPETEERVLAIDRMGWEGDDLKVYGPSTTLQPAPRRPLVSGFTGFVPQRGAHEPDLQVSEPELRLPANASAALALPPLENFVLEVSLRAQGRPRRSRGQGRSRRPPEESRGPGLGSDGFPGIYLGDGYGHDFRLAFSGREGWFRLETNTTRSQHSLPDGFDPDVFHLLRIESHAGKLRVELDGRQVSPDDLHLPGPQWDGLRQVALFAQETPALCAGFALSESLETPSP